MHFFFLHISRAQRFALARTRTWVIQLEAQCTDHWTTEQSHGVGVPVVQLTTHVKSSTLCSHTVVCTSKFFLAWWVTTTLYNYGATLCELHYNESNIRCWYFEHHPFVICSDEGPTFKMSALKSLGWPIYIINKVNITKWS